MLFLIGLGLADEKDITVKGLEAIRGSKRVYLEAYTSILGVDQAKLEAFYGKPLILADRDMVETESDAILDGADKDDVSFLVVGDPFGATTHTDLHLRATALGITTRVIHNASIMNAVGACGLALYNFGQTVSIPFFTDSWRPSSWFDRIHENNKLGLHTLCLLDIKVKEQSEENLARGRKIFEPARYMSVPTAVEQILSLLRAAPTDGSKAALDPAETLAISVSRVGAEDQTFVAGTLAELAQADQGVFGAPLHSLVIVGRRFHHLERDFAAGWALDQERWRSTADSVYHCRS
ncbi:uncharacterized protein L969DRAFT_105526 [Mixia osmundae IAM 14324]|uniref:diphthine methyl ester synthase n=1 Tax=Mixia osmundae (strain CBS 9802 / IAM 14324 / JCM 22182 / KY 12970) TaxID=764103 RepID=G7E296_MIXOS|nr:uncharacterized protein L969DRAFT_105526 [Mixia osmundae IAM 14324]KEI36829.1 hypothetical protein L969DRAFT_105526 [Mixia osmundae IAM 14324]GAA96956.1 hypothetical protein E5Q_03630 [Mixia osmundae IAM 14324]